MGKIRRRLASVFQSWEPIVGVALGLISILNGAAFRAGWTRRGMAWYWCASEPFYRRHLAFGSIPVGAMFVFGVVGADLMSYAGQRYEPAGWALVALAAASGAIWLLVSLSPPKWLKPAWLLHEEATRGVPRHPTGAVRVLDVGLVAVGVVLLTIGGLAAAWGAVATAT